MYDSQNMWNIFLQLALVLIEYAFILNTSMPLHIIMSFMD